MQQYHYSSLNGHVIAQINGRRFLVETGMPYSMADRPLLLDGRRIDMNSEVMGLTLGDLSRQAGLQLDGTLGGDVSNQFVVSIQPREQQITFDHYLADYPIDIQVDNMGGLAVMHQTINGKHVKAALDLGCSLSLVRQDMLGDLAPRGRQSEVFWFIGEREVDVFTLPVMIGKQLIPMAFGVMPREIEHWLDMANIRATLGSELLQHFALSLALQEGSLMLDPLH